MKTIYRNSIYVLLALATMTSCAQDKSKKENKDNHETVAIGNDEVRMEKPESMDMSKEDLDNEVQGKAVEVVELLVARDPSVALLPVEVATVTRDLIADLKMIKFHKKIAEEAIEDDYLQVARHAIADMASEVEISTVSVPLATYPDAMKLAAVLLDADKMEEAKVALFTALNTMVIEKEIIPLPILRAEVMIVAAQTEDAKDEDKKKAVLNLLENAEYQLILAEELGYGKRDKEYKELNKAIKEIKDSVNEDKDSQGLFDKLKNKLKKFKNRTSTKTSNQ